MCATVWNDLPLHVASAPSLAVFLPRHYHMTHVLLSPFITTVWTPVVLAIINIIWAILKMVIIIMMMMMTLRVRTMTFDPVPEISVYNIRYNRGGHAPRIAWCFRRPGSATSARENPAKLKLLTQQLMKSNSEKNRMTAEIKSLKEDLQRCMDSKQEKQKPQGRSPPVSCQSAFFRCIL